MSRPVRKIKTGYREIGLREILADKDKKVRLYLLVGGVFLVIWGFTSGSANQSSSLNSSVVVNTSPGSDIVSFSQEPVTVEKGLLSGTRNNKSSPPVRIVISSVGIDLPVKEAKVVKGYWEVFPDKAGFGLGSAYPEEIGNTVIFAHARRGQFFPLKDIKSGDEVIVYTKDRWFSYRVDKITEVLSSQTEVIAQAKESILTLYTCTGFADSKRFIVRARRI